MVQALLNAIEYPVISFFVHAAPPAITVNPSLGLNNVIDNSPVFTRNIASVDSIISLVLSLVFSLAGLVALALIIYAGFTYVVSSGDQSKVEQSRKTLTNAVIGLIIVLLAYFITSFVLSFFGVTTCSSFSILFNILPNVTSNNPHC